MTSNERKMLTDTITNLHGLAKGMILFKWRLEEAEKQIVVLQKELLGMQLRTKGNDKPH